MSVLGFYPNADSKHEEWKRAFPVDQRKNDACDVEKAAIWINDMKSKKFCNDYNLLLSSSKSWMLIIAAKNAKNTTKHARPDIISSCIDALGERWFSYCNCTFQYFLLAIILGDSVEMPIPNPFILWDCWWFIAFCRWIFSFFC